MRPRFSDNDLWIVSYTERHDVSRFSSTEKELNDFLKEDALENQQVLISKTYLCCYSSQLIGYVTLTTDIIRKKYVWIDDRIEAPYKEYPAIKVARLATDKKYEGRGVGTFLLLAAIGIAADMSEKVGCRFITVDSKRHSIGFYEKHGFKLVRKYEKLDHPTMYLDILPAIEEMKPITDELGDFI